MIAKLIQPWIAVRAWIDDDYRETVIRTALDYLIDAPPDLHLYCLAELTRGLGQPSKRILQGLIDPSVKGLIMMEMRRVPIVATAILCLWAEARRDLIEIVRQSAEAAGFTFEPEWGWEEARRGYYEEVHFPQFARWLKQQTQGRPSETQKDYHLAALWLSRALLREPAALPEALPALALLPAPEAEDEPGEVISPEILVFQALQSLTPKLMTAAPSEDPLPQAQAGPPRPLPEGPPLAGEPLLPVEAALPPVLEPGPTVLIFQQDLKEVYRLLQSQHDMVRQAQKRVLLQAQELARLAQENDLLEMQFRYPDLGAGLGDWHSELQEVRTLEQDVIERLESELALRPDLNPARPWVEAPAASPQPLDALASIFDQLQEYDDQKQSLLNETHAHLAEIARLKEDLSGWLPAEPLGRAFSTASPIDEDDKTLKDVREICQQAQARRQALEEQKIHLRELSLNRIAETLIRLREFELPGNSPLIEGYTLGQVMTANRGEFESSLLRALEATLASRLDEQIVRRQAVTKDPLSASLRAAWDEEAELVLVDKLVEDRRDVEVALLLIAANRVHPRQTPLCLQAKHVASLLVGLEHLSAGARPFGLLNLLGPDLCVNWDIQDPAAQAELGLVFLAAAYRGPFSLPDGFLWEQVALDWPLETMPAWKQLWEAEINNTPLPILVQNQDLLSELKQARNEAVNILAHQDGIYLKANSARKSTRHQSLLNNILLPLFSHELEALVYCDQFIRERDTFEKDDLTEGFKKYILRGEDAGALRAVQTHRYNWMETVTRGIETYLAETLPHKYEEDAIPELYDREAAIDGIRDPEPFHRRNIIGVMEDCAQAIQRYGRALQSYWENEKALETRILSTHLKNELAALPEMSPLGQAAFDAIVAGRLDLPPRDEKEAHRQANQQIAQMLLSQATYAMRLPRLVGHLTHARLGQWEQTLLNLLDDLAEPLNKVQAAEFLKEALAPNQVLLLTQFIPLGLQKEAQNMQREQEREVENLHSELLRLGGNLEELAQDRELGRFTLLRQELAQRVLQRKNAADAARRQAQDLTRQAMMALNELEMKLFDREDSIPPEAYSLVREGIQQARAVAANSMAVDQVQAFIQEINFRLERDAWMAPELQQVNNQLERIMTAEDHSADAALDANKALELLERGNLQGLGLRADDLLPSTITTRTELLDNWLKVLNLPTLDSDGLTSIQQSYITLLFSRFAEMMSLRRVKTADNKPLEFTQPFVYSYWQLQYPKTEALMKNCVLAALPGNPPTPKDVSTLENWVIEKELMTWFVIVFVPGLNPKLRNRLQNFIDQRYKENRMILIDEPALMRMILAEREGLNPLACLRPLMLRNLKVNIGVFNSNNEVDSQNAIFVGRDAEIERIASSGDSFAVYGGRRIGKSSLLRAIRQRLERRGVLVISHSFEGENCNEDETAHKLADFLALKTPVDKIGDLKAALQEHLRASPETRIVLILDEIDKYIDANKTRHLLIEVLRSISNEFTGQFRVVIAGFMGLYDCLKGRGPYTPTSDPWGRLLNEMGPLGNLRPAYAEAIIKEGFVGILGWSFENRAIPQRIVELTGCHPAFVQNYCSRIQDRVAPRGNKLILLSDVEAVFNDLNTEHSFIAYVRKTLDMNLIDPVSKYLVVWLAAYYNDTKTFTLEQLRELAGQTDPKIPEAALQRSLEKMVVTSVVRERAPQLYEFSVPDYPSILKRLGETAYLEKLEDDLQKHLMEHYTDEFA